MAEKCLDCDCDVIDFLSYTIQRNELLYCPYHFLARKWNDKLSVRPPYQVKWILDKIKNPKDCEKGRIKDYNKFILQPFHPKEWIFCGSGAWTEIQIWLMHEKLSQAFVYLSGMQQSPMSTDIVDELKERKFQKEAQEYINACAKEIGIALGATL